MFEDFLNAMQNFRRNKIRTFLSLLGVIIGVASVIVIMSMGQSSTLQIQDTFGSSGLNFVSLQPSNFARRFRGNGMTISFDENFREELFDSFENVKKIWYKNGIDATISFGETDANASLTAVETGYLETYGLQLDYGNFFSVSDEYNGAQKIIIGSEVAKTLFPSGNAVGENVTVKASKAVFNFEIVGVLKEKNSGMESSTDGVFVPRGFYTKQIAPHPKADIAMVESFSPAKASALTNELETYFEEKTGDSYAIQVFSMQSLLDQVNEITATMSAMLSAIAAISLIVGGIGIMNIMIVTVTERKQEIGIRKALGAKPSAIRRQFLVESASISLAGGILGIFVGMLLSLAVEYVFLLSFVVSFPSCLVSFVFSAFVGIFFGFHPASKAAQLNPVDALSEN